LAGDFVSEYVGMAIFANHLPSLLRRNEGKSRLYIMKLNNDIYLDATQKGHLSRFINHICGPNCIIERWNVNGIPRLAIVAIRHIKPLEEVTFDYQWQPTVGQLLVVVVVIIVVLLLKSCYHYKIILFQMMQLVLLIHPIPILMMLLSFYPLMKFSPVMKLNN
jgi:SET domain